MFEGGTRGAIKTPNDTLFNKVKENPQGVF